MNDQSNDIQVFRIIDANFNRASEGLRVVEEYLRMILNDSHLTERCKAIRHELGGLLSESFRSQLSQSRNSSGDIGREIETDTEHVRSDPRDVLAANLKRIQQSLRAIEEFSKVLPNGPSRIIEQLRFNTYELEKTINGVLRSEASIPCPAVHVLIDAQDSSEQFAAVVRELVDAGADFIQLRSPDVTDLVLFERAKTLVQMTKDAGSRSIINDRPDVAATVHADGVHLGQDDLPIRAARSILRPGQLIGYSTHSLEQALDAVDQGADYIGVGPVFPSKTKSFDEYVGTELVKQVLKKTKIPAFAIGGIDTLNIKILHEVGCTRVAVSAAVTGANDKGLAIAALKGQASNQTLLSF